MLTFDLLDIKYHEFIFTTLLDICQGEFVPNLKKLSVHSHGTDVRSPQPWPFISDQSVCACDLVTCLCQIPQCVPYHVHKNVMDRWRTYKHKEPSHCLRWGIKKKSAGNLRQPANHEDSLQLGKQVKIFVNVQWQPIFYYMDRRVIEDSWNKEKPFSLIAGSRLVGKAHFISYY